MKVWFRWFCFSKGWFSGERDGHFQECTYIYIYIYIWVYLCMYGTGQKFAALPGCDTQCTILSLRNPVPISHQRGPFLKENESSEPSINFQGIALFVGVVFTHTHISFIYDKIYNLPYLHHPRNLSPLYIFNTYLQPKPYLLVSYCWWFRNFRREKPHLGHIEPL